MDCQIYNRLIRKLLILIVKLTIFIVIFYIPDIRAEHRRGNSHLLPEEGIEVGRA